MAETDPRENSDDLKPDGALPDRDPFEGLGADDLDLDLDLPEIEGDAGETHIESIDETPSAIDPLPSVAATTPAEPTPVAPALTPVLAPANSGGTGAQRKKRTALLLGIAALLIVVLPLGWLGWAFMQDRNELDAIDSGLDAARDAAERTIDAPEDGPERQQAQALKSRIDAIDSAEWWDRVVARIIAADDISRLKSEAEELTGLLTRRSANRAWWRSRMAKLDEEIAVNDRTIAQVESIKEELATPALPHGSDGGVSQETIAATQGKIDAALAELVQMQSQAVAIFATAALRSVALNTMESLATMEAEIDASTPIDRRPPEIAQVREAAKRAIAAAREVLERRDSVLMDFAEIRENASALDREAAEASAVQALTDRLNAVVFDQSDERFQACVQPKIAAQDAIEQAQGELASRDSALLWVQDWMQRVNDSPDLESLLAALQTLSSETPPSSELQVVRSALMDFEARVRSRTEELVIEKAEREASLARAAACAARLEAFASALEASDFSGAASELDGATPETEEQTAEVDLLKTAFGAVLKDWLSEATTNAEAVRDTADQLRACLENEAVTRITPDFAAQAAEVWPRVLEMEDRSLYEALQQLVGGPADKFEVVALWYLDPFRTRGGPPQMRAEIEAAVEAMKQPPVTLQVEGIEWSSVPCDWSRPQTDVTVAIGDDVRVYRLGPVVPQTTSLLSVMNPFEQRFTLPRDTTLTISVRGNFGCDGGASRFRGSGEVTIDDLRAGGRLALPFQNGGDDRTNPHKLILVAFPDEEVRRALELPDWNSTRSSVNNPPATTERPVGDAPTEDAPMGDDPMGTDPVGDDPMGNAPMRGA